MPTQIPTMADCPIETETLLARCLSDADFVREMLGIFRTQALQHVETFKAAVTAGDVEGVRKVAHAMKGSSANLSADSLSKLCAVAEQDAKAGRLPTAAAVAAIEQELQRVFAYFPTVEARLA